MSLFKKTSLSCQAAQPGLRPRCFELQGPLVPARRFPRIGLDPLHIPTRELVRILGLGHLHRGAREPQIGGADVELARNGNVALRDMAIAQLHEPLRTLEVFRWRGLAAGRRRRIATCLYALALLDRVLQQLKAIAHDHLGVPIALPLIVEPLALSDIGVIGLEGAIGLRLRSEQDGIRNEASLRYVACLLAGCGSAKQRCERTA